MKQTQDGIIFKLPFTIDVYEGGTKKRYNEWMNDSTASYSFAANTRPDLVIIDADKALVWEKTDHKTADEFIYQYNHAGSYVDRREAIAFFLNNINEPKRIEFLQTALKDSNVGLRRMILQRINLNNDTVKNSMRTVLESIAANDPKSLVRADAIADLSAYTDPKYKALFTKAVSDSSYTVAGNALDALSKIDSATALTMAQSLLKQPAKGQLQNAFLNILSNYGSASDYTYIYNTFEQAGIQARLGMMNSMATALSKEKDAAFVKKQVDMLAGFRENLPAFLSQFGGPVINNSLGAIATAVKTKGDSVLANYILSRLPADAQPKKEISMSVDELQKYTGEYEINGTRIRVYIENATLILLVPGQQAYPLVPYEKNKFTLKTLPGFNAQFNTSDKGEVTEMVLLQPNGTFTAKKVK